MSRDELSGYPCPSRDLDSRCDDTCIVADVCDLVPIYRRHIALRKAQANHRGVLRLARKALLATGFERPETYLAICRSCGTRVSLPIFEADLYEHDAMAAAEHAPSCTTGRALKAIGEGLKDPG